MRSQLDPLNLIICGVGGQGNILISRLLGRSFSRRGYSVTIGETFGAAQRGGAVFSGLRISKGKFYGPLIPEGKGHIILSLEPLEALRNLDNYGNPKVVVVSNLQPVFPVGVLSKSFVYPGIQELQSAIRRLSRLSWFLNATDMAMALGSPIVANVIMLGALLGSSELPLSIQDVKQEIRDTLPESTLDLNLQALNLGFQETKSRD